MKRFFVLTALLLLLTGCASAPPAAEAGTPASFRQISQEEAMEMMAADDGHVIVDVRRQEEYDAGHIPGAILIPNETITDGMPAELPDPDQIILVYCRRGNRSKEAAQKLVEMGYRNVYEFGGIETWPGEIVTEEGKDMSEAGYDAVPAAVRPVPELIIDVNGRQFRAALEDNSSAQAFAERLSEGPVTVDMEDYGDFEKVGDLPWSLPRNDASITTEPGDVILYQGDQITIYYGENTWSFTRLAKIGGVTREELLEALGTGGVTVSFRVEWSE